MILTLKVVEISNTRDYSGPQFLVLEVYENFKILGYT